MSNIEICQKDNELSLAGKSNDLLLPRHLPVGASRRPAHDGWLSTGIALLCLGLAGCGPSDDLTDTSSQSATGSAPAITATTATATADAASPSDRLDTPAPQPSHNSELALAADSGASFSSFRTTKATPSELRDICNDVLARNLQLVGGTVRHVLPLTTRPAQGVATSDPTYGSCVVRLTNHSETGSRFHRNDYSRRQAFNNNSTLMILYAEDGYWHLYNARTGKWIKRLNGPAGDAEPQWHPTQANTLYYLPTNGVGMKIYQLDVQSNTSSVVADMASQIRKYWPDAHTAWTRSEGSPSANGRYWCFMTEHISNGQWLPRGVFTWDLQQHRIVGTLNVSARPDHVSMSPSAQYCVVSGDDSTGTRAYRWNFKAPYSSTNPKAYLQLHHKSEHSDLALNASKEDVYVSIDYQANQGDVFMVNLKTGEKTSLFPTYLDRTATAIHVSGKSFRKPGWALISTYGESHVNTYWQNLRDSSSRQWLHRKIFAVSLEKNPQIRSIAYAHSDALSYWAEPHATVNKDFSRILFNSTWNSSNGKDVETYMTAIHWTALDRPAR